LSSDPSSYKELLLSNLELGRELSARTLMFHAAIAERVGLSATEHKALDILSRSRAMTAGQLAEVTGLTTGAITGLTDRLEKVGFVRRERDVSERRKVMIYPVMEKIEQEIAPLFISMSQQTEQLLSRYSEQELAIIQDFIQRSIVLLQEETNKLKSSGG
jgi:DNA-binding MarR family transcriptional regulator